MCNNDDHSGNHGRREVLKMLGALSLTGLTGVAQAAGQGAGQGAGQEGAGGALIPGTGWVAASSDPCPGDGTPLQFIPKTVPDENPLDAELAKYPKCPYCGMDRTRWNHSRHLVQYDDDLVDGTCSIHCLALSLSLNLDRGPKAIYAADFGADEQVKPLVPVDDATYLIGSKLKGTMTRTSKMAFSHERAAKAAEAEQGGETGRFEDALRQAFIDLSEDTLMIRKRRSERRNRMMQKP